ncbi:putative Zn-dependent peptidase [Anseongella ginsenosidimutans]|uniref:Putative Zn-dependent peptidase n=1 Tax=Anseongella ginsenosidimutans TaxID=496056 RepID=A0A4R3KNU4_9SPHI|nr:pitrilysin family protein [Anseongella ginsenosidimutans]QEC53715.1 insulinase family protein [Anseongella ginsenosidimutans]TCS86034.1 putative Zn-dependent peptidase [Anseongella ginsenosidimutans]
MLNRTLAPENNPLKPIQLLKPVRSELKGGARLYVIDGADADVVRIEFIFPHTGWEAEQPLVNRALAGMLLEGTAKHTAAEIAETIDFYGAFLNADNGADHTIVTLHSLNKQLQHTLPLVKEVLTEAVFPAAELEVFSRNSLQKLQVSLEKNEFQARRAFNAAVFGGNSPYGYSVEPSDFEKIDRQALIRRYHEQFSPANCIIIVSGKAGTSVPAEVERLFGNGDWPAMPVPAYEPVLQPGLPGKYPVEIPGSLQSAIRIGKPAITKAHPDYAELQVLNTVLGGYFGSRLMANIREDKGYTYGIGSGLHSFRNSGLFFIATEVGAEVREKALQEIYLEMDRLRNDLIPGKELDLVRNYLLGSFLGSLENVFSHADKLKNLLLSGLDYTYYDRYFEAIRDVKPERLRELAGSLFSDGFYEITAG